MGLSLSGPAGGRYYWDGALSYDPPSGLWGFNVGWRIYYDGVTASEEKDVEKAIGGIPDGYFVRSFQAVLRAHLGEHLRFKVKYDLRGQDVKVRDIYVDLTGTIRVDSIRLGYMPEPVGLEHLMSFNNLTFMERGLPYAFSHLSNLGIMARKNFPEDRGVAMLGVFNQVGAYNQAPRGSWYLSGRLTALPWTGDRPNDLLHLGLAGSWRAPNGAVQYRARPETGDGPYYIQTGEVDSSREFLLGLEGAWQKGPFCMQSEAMIPAVETSEPGVPDRVYESTYVFASWVLTGEQRGYDRDRGLFLRVIPEHPLYGGIRRERGIGAWEIASRFSLIDMRTGTDSAPSAGRLRDWTTGLNWYLSRNSRLMLNYVRAWVDRPDVRGDSDILEMRVQVNY